MQNQEAYEPPKPSPRFYYGYIVVAAAFVIMVVTFGTSFSYGVFFKPMLAEFGWTRAITSGAFSLCILMQGLLAIMMGGLNDRFGPRIVVTICGIFMAAGYLLVSQVSAVWQLYLFYGVIIGVGMSGTLVPLLSTVVMWFTKRRGMMAGIVMMGQTTGALFGPPLANWLILTYDWRLSFFILGIIMLVVVVLAAQFLRREPTRMHLVTYGESRGPESSLESGREGLTFREALYTMRYWTFFAMFFCWGVCMFVIMVHIVPHATDLGISAANAANILATIGGLGIVGLLVLGSVGDRIGNWQAYIIGFAIMLAALFWLVPSNRLWMLYLFAVVFGFGRAGMQAVVAPLIADLFGLRSHGIIFGSFSFGFSFGAALGPYLAGYIFDVTDSYYVAFLLCAAVGVVGLILVFMLRPAKRPV